MIERNFDIPFVAAMALREKQIQQNYRPVIAVHKWFARRPGTLFRALLLAEFTQGPLRETYFQPHRLEGIRVADPFMGGGTPLIEANRIGCGIIGYDINPMAYWIVRQEIERLDLDAYRLAAAQLRQELEKQVGRFYRTRCLECGSPEAYVKYFIWVKTQHCVKCGREFELFPGYLLAENRRHPLNVIICRNCGELNEVPDRKAPGDCRVCTQPLQVSGPARHNRCTCPHCGHINSYPNPAAGPPTHRMVAIEYHCPSCKPHHRGRFFKKPDGDDLSRYAEVEAMWTQTTPLYTPDEEIPAGDETDRLHRWGYRRYREMFNGRQLLGLELSCRLIAKVHDERVRNALATNLSDLLRYQNMLCRYDTMALKSLDIFSVHGFPVGLIPCESNLLGIPNGLPGTNVGSGGWSNIVDKYARAKAYCENPYEIRYQNGRKILDKIPGEWIGDYRDSTIPAERREVRLHCGSSTLAEIPPASLDAVVTDPPYFANVQYAELMDFCYVWLRRLAIDVGDAFRRMSTRDPNELTGNATLGRDLNHFTEGMSTVFRRMAQALKPGAPLVFTYHHNAIDAYYPIAVAILDAGLTCSACLPCPAEMGASIHINGTASSIVDTVFICRSTGSVPRRTIVTKPEDLARLVLADLEQLQAGDVKPTHGDIRCITYGHLVRLAIWHLRALWQKDGTTPEKLTLIAKAIADLGGPGGVQSYLSDALSSLPRNRRATAHEATTIYEVDTDEIPF
ncbi:MAG: DUF1156 domain-containing protein [Thermoanaerobacterales bacterium]|nr:DUF1156 domain-containing protein [Thermoanaerobacterales bacterium]